MIQKIRQWLLSVLADRNTPSANTLKLALTDLQKKYESLMAKYFECANAKVGNEVYTVIQMPSAERAEDYSQAMNSFYKNNNVLAFFFLQEREWIARVKDGKEDVGVARGALLAIEQIQRDLAREAAKYDQIMIGKEVANGKV